MAQSETDYWLAMLRGFEDSLCTWLAPPPEPSPAVRDALETLLGDIREAQGKLRKAGSDG